MTVDPNKLEDHLEAVQKKYAGLIQKGSSYDDPERIPFGSPSMNWITSGGVPRGRWVRFWGPWSSGKTASAWTVIAEAQQMGLLCAYYNIEGQYSPAQALNYGVDIDALEIVETNRIEVISDTAETLLGSIHLHVFDSCTKAESVDALAGEASDWHRGLAPRVWNKVFKRMADKFDTTENTIIYIDHARINQKTGGMYAPGGEGMDHASDMTVQFRKGSWLFRHDDGELYDKEQTGKATFSGEKEPDGIEFIVRVQKSRVSRPMRPAVVRFDYDDASFDVEWEMMRRMVYDGLASKSEKGGWYSIPVEEAKKPLRLQGEKKLRAYIRERPELQEELVERIMAA